MFFYLIELTIYRFFFKIELTFYSFVLSRMNVL